MSKDLNINNSSLVFSTKNTSANEKEKQNSQTVPIVQKTIEDSVEIISQKLGEEKKSNKKAIAVGTSVLFLSTMVAVLNPKYSKKLIKKLNNWQNNLAVRLEQNKSKNTFSGKVQRNVAKTIDWTMRTLQFSNNINSLKDIYFKKLCTDKKSFSFVRNKNRQKFLRGVDSVFTNVMSKPHKIITGWFDNIGKSTIKRKYNSISNNMDSLDLFLNKYKSKLSAEEKIIFESKLAEIKKIRQYYTEESILKRLNEQEVLMENLENNLMYHFRQYRKGFGNKWVDKGTHVSKNMTFWAEEIMMSERNKLNTQGMNVTNKLFTHKSSKESGLYNDLFDLVGKHLNHKEKEMLKSLLGKTENKLRKANKSECIDYFDKKRDLVLGSAPTDIVTAIGGLGLSGVFIATADTKEERISNALTGAFPIIAGLGASMAFTAMLFSGIKGMLYGTLTSIGLSKMGNLIDKKIFGHDIDKDNIITENKEIKNV